MTETRPCLYGCTLHDHHLTDCPGDCRGCLPRHVETPGRAVCDTCTTVLTGALRDVPELVDRLHVLGRPNAAARALSDDIQHRTDPAESTVLPAQWLDADELLSILHGWAEVTRDTHPQHPTPPRRRDGWDTGPIVTWVGNRLGWMLTQGWVVDFRRELPSRVRALDERWPGMTDVEPARRIEQFPCSRCDLMGTVVYTPAQWPGAPFQVECTNPDCRRMYSEAEWERYKALTLIAARTRA